jgi:Skp family chaperone for outer membrane proteins
MCKPHGVSVRAALLFLALLGFDFGSVAEAATQLPPQTLNIMVVDLQTLLQKSRAAQMVSHQIQAKRADYNKEIAAAEQNLKKEKDTLEREQASLSPKVLNERERRFQEELNAFKQRYRGKFEQIQASSNEALAKIQKAISQIINKFAKERKVNFVFPRAELLFWDKSFDVTDEVLKELDKELPTLTVSFGKPSRLPASAPARRHPTPRRK